MTRAESIVLLAVIAGSALVDFIGIILRSGDDALLSILSIATTLSFAPFIWSPVLASSILAVTVTATFLFGDPSTGLVGAAIAAAPVTRTASTRLFLWYTGGLLAANAVFASGVLVQDAPPANVTISLALAASAGGIGFALRRAGERGRRLEREIEEHAEREREAVLAERRWIAGELHDSIAHHLTVIALHTQMLDDETVRQTSQGAISNAAKQALSDLRFVIQLADDVPRESGDSTSGLASAVDEAAAEFEAAGHSVQRRGDPANTGIPRGAALILARVVRESATNILKYAGPGTISIDVSVTPSAIAVEILSPLSDAPRKAISSTGTGVDRMAERVLGVSGSFSAGPTDGRWRVAASVPTGEHRELWA